MLAGGRERQPELGARPAPLVRDLGSPPASPPSEERGHAQAFLHRRRDFVASLLIGLFCLLVYNANGRAISAGDTYPARYLPFAILHHGTLRLDPLEKLTAQGRGGAAFWIQKVPGGHAISLYPVVVPVLLAPLYLPAVAYLNLRGWERVDYVASVMEKLCASFVAALSSALLYLLLRRRTSERLALLLSLAYAFGTTTWMISSQALWQHGMGQLLVIGALLSLTAPCSAWRALAAGLLCGLIASNRPPDTLLAATLGCYGLFWSGRRAPLLAAAGALPAGLALFYNLSMAGHFAGAYGLRGGPSFFRHDLLYGIGGVLFSPTRGLFVFSPFLLFIALAWRHLPSGRDQRRLTLAMSAGVVLQVLLYAKADWRAGISWGPRYMTDLLPLLMWMLVPVVASLRGLGRTCFHLAVGAAVVIEAIGAFWYTGKSDLPLFEVGKGHNKMRAAWAWRNAPFIASFQQGPAPAELMTEVRGTFDAIKSNGRETDVVTAGEELAATGWALAGRRTPSHVAVIIDDRQTFASNTFVDRPDVRETLHEVSRSGWRIPLSTAALTPGEHHLKALAWASPKGEGRFIGDQKLTVLAAPTSDGGRLPAEAEPGASKNGQIADGNLAASARTAEARIREHQDGAGYWLTAHTTTTHFEAPSPEMNTFLTGLLVDLLGPLESTGGFGDSLARARRHLTDQIERGGLVRYHGLPDGPGIGRLGCAITPDTDDTALVWRIAPAGDVRRRSTALATIDQYRTRDGLYRTWLAPTKAYQCLNPGSDPNPTDLTIQMHLLMLLAQVRPPAARALCSALQPVLDQDRVWVYYRMAPLVPTLRLTDLRRAGCALKLPESRIGASVPGQEIWVASVRWLGLTPPADSAEIQAVLRRLAKDDFALLRENPPLLYHNDLTASVPRYYWSEDVGYALWRRLYEYAHLGHAHIDR